MNPDNYYQSDWLSSFLLPAFIIVVAVIVIIKLNLPLLKQSYREWRTTRLIDQFGLDQIKHWRCYKDQGGQFSIDRMILMSDRIVAINFKPYIGHIYGSENVEEWTQVIDQKNYKFGNPLLELENQTKTIKHIAGDVTVTGYLFFGHHAYFPKGKPGQVFTPFDIPPFLSKNLDKEASKKILEAWDVIKNLEVDDPTDYRPTRKT
jgi:hypothetical protein